jgi:hypothetical protein
LLDSDKDYMVNFLLWNIQKKNLLATIVRLVMLHDIDILMLIESNEEPNIVLRTLNKSFTGNLFDYPISLCNHVQIYTRFPEQFARPIYEDNNRFTIRHIALPGMTDIILVVIHFVSKIHVSDKSQSMQAIEFVGDIIRTEKRIGHSRTVVTGDLNMNPFEDGMMSANGLHGSMSRNIALKGSRIVQGKKYDFFYNPMWSLMGDKSPAPPGTLYDYRSEMISYFWNMYDQVLIRPELITRFSNDDLKIIYTDGNTSFLKPSGEPDEKNFSDHLPITFKLDL